MANTIMNTLNKLFKKADQTEERYIQALEKKEEGLLALQLELKEETERLKGLHKMKLLGDVSEEHYDAEAEKVEKLQKKVVESQKEIQLIQEYKTEDIKSVIEELDEQKKKHFKEHAEELENLKTEVLEAKQKYLEALCKSRARYVEIVEPERKLDRLKIAVGIKKNSYISGSHDTLNMISNGGGGHESLLVERKELYDALEYGRTSESLKRTIAKRKYNA